MKNNKYSKVGQEAEVWSLAWDGPQSRLVLPEICVVKFWSGIFRGYELDPF